ncbi:MAG: anti-sigma-F factor Fin family protein [Firmicutes bacterium]|nr:anti-sigma-F factor Fin family protein [Bacillota bacterium]
MQVEYFCRRCGSHMATLNLPAVNEAALGLHALTPEERADIITFDALAERMRVKSICDECAAGARVGGDRKPRLLH